MRVLSCVRLNLGHVLRQTVACLVDFDMIWSPTECPKVHMTNATIDIWLTHLLSRQIDIVGLLMCLGRTLMIFSSLCSRGLPSDYSEGASFVLFVAILLVSL